MQDPVNDLLFGDELSPERMELLRTALERDAALRDALVQWRGLVASLRQRLDESVPDRRLFVLYVLTTSGHSGLLTEEEREEVSASWAEIESATKVHPGLVDVAARISKEKADFDRCWEWYDSGRRPGTVRSMRWTWRVAAAIMVAGIVGVLTYFLRSDKTLQIVATEAGQSEQVVLPDGSEVYLAGGAELRFAVEAFERTVELEGRAFFDITPAPERFVVLTPSAEATVLGTRFGIRATREATEVVLESGSLALAAEGSPDSRVILRPGEMSSVERGGLPSAPIMVNVPQALSWTGFMFFRATPMAEVAERLSEAFGVLVVVGPELRGEAVSGRFDQREGLQHILMVLSRAVGATVEGSETSGFSMRAIE